MSQEKHSLIQRIYNRFLWLVSRPQERGSHSAGYWMGKVRQTTVALCAKSAGNLLDVGCGEGLFLTEMAGANKKLRLSGLDNLPERVARAGEKMKQQGLEEVQLRLGDATQMPFPDAQFETVVCLNLIFNLPTLEIVSKFLQEMKRVAVPGGRIIFDIKNAANPLLYWKYRLAPWYDPTVKDHILKTYRLEEIIQLLTQLDLRITGKTAIGFPWVRLAPVILIEAEKK